ncbi:MAG: TIGR03618 family F420-dependent PPOX class oxidoreductase [Acidimicrobiia bacterium]|jgi:PPOX class probable F420-dependent enzyme|nr:TIGR03618 family F420-dependent PPOX class oxidoreductase [Acidimicrobiia bacterium]MBP8182024.1 TIGR03618 family F420-dependent PPOX class oxidoreductase [Acidimicrobiia bacterium]
MRKMTEPEWIDFINTGTRTGKLSVNLPTGQPTVTPVWFRYGDDGVIRFNTEADSPKARAIEVDPRVCLLVDVEEPPYAFVRIYGQASIGRNEEYVRRIATELGGRYMGQDRAEEYGQRNGSVGEVVVEVRPTKVTALADIAG